MRQGSFTCSRPCTFEENKNEKKTHTHTHTHQKIPPTQTHHDIHSSPATATTSRRRATKHVSRVSPYSPASIVPGLWKSAPCSTRNCLWKKRPRLLPSLGLFFYGKLFREQRKKTTHHRYQQSSQRPPQGIPLLQSCEVALE